MTKKNNANSARRKLIPAVGMLVASAMMLSSSTYAWFTMNDSVTVTGMTLKTKVSGNLLVCDTNVEDDYTTALTQAAKGILEPVSSAYGQDGTFFYTINAKANGDAITDDYVAYNPSTAATNTTDYDSAFSEAYHVSKTVAPTLITGESGAKGYVDYVFYLKGTSDVADQQILMTECNLLYNGAAINDTDNAAVDKDNAWRIAVFADDITTYGGKGTDGDGANAGSDNPAAAPQTAAHTAKAILTRSGATNQDGTKAVTVAATAPSVSASYNTWDATNIGSLGAAGSTAYYKVTVRVWLEGEDTSCKSSTYAALTNAYQLGVKFELSGGSKAAVANIQSDTSKVKAAGA
jgi:hypothetical protein